MESDARTVSLSHHRNRKRRVPWHEELITKYGPRNPLNDAEKISHLKMLLRNGKRHPPAHFLLLTAVTLEPSAVNQEYIRRISKLPKYAFESWPQKPRSSDKEISQFESSVYNRIPIRPVSDSETVICLKKLYFSINSIDCEPFLMLLLTFLILETKIALWSLRDVIKLEEVWHG